MTYQILGVKPSETNGDVAFNTLGRSRRKPPCSHAFKPHGSHDFFVEIVDRSWQIMINPPSLDPFTQKMMDFTIIYPWKS